VTTLLALTPSHAVQGGVEIILEALADGLPAHGFRVIVGLARGARFHDPDAYRRAYPRLETIEVDAGTGTRLGRVRGLRRALERVRPDIVLNARLFDAYAAVAESKLRGQELRFATTIQADEPGYVDDLARYAAFVDLCVTSGTRVAREVRARTSLPPEQVVSIAGGVHPPRREVVRDDARPLRLGYVGRFDQPQKRVLDLPEVLAELEARGVPWSCTLVGAGPDEAELRRALEARGWAARVTCSGWASHERLYTEVYPALDVFLHAAAFEGITIAPREAMAHGAVPVVARFPGLVEEGQFVEGRTALTFDVGDTRAAADAVERLHRDRDLWGRLSQAARASQQGERSHAGALRAWAEALRGTLARPPRRAAASPVVLPPDGRLARWHVPPGLAELLRRWLRWHARAADPGSEWPHRGPGSTGT
jgi:glycosyltransferase involved in cell wall biosynthesis